MGTPAFDDDDTAPVPCGCAPCLERLRLQELAQAAQITRVTSIHAPHAARDPFTVYLVNAVGVQVDGKGETEEQAIAFALAKLGAGT